MKRLNFLRKDGKLEDYNQTMLEFVKFVRENSRVNSLEEVAYIATPNELELMK